MLDRLKRWFQGRNEEPVVVHTIPLSWLAQQIPADLLATGLYWVWDSVRNFSAVDRALPDSRPPTALTAELSPTLSAELEEYDFQHEAHRLWTMFATSAPMELSAQEQVAAIRAFASTGAGPLVAILLQSDPCGPSLVFLPRATSAELTALVASWQTSLGNPASQLNQRGSTMVKALFLDPKTLAAGVIKGFPAQADNGPASRR